MGRLTLNDFWFLLLLFREHTLFHNLSPTLHAALSASGLDLRAPGELSMRLQKRTLLCFNDGIKSPLSLLFPRVNSRHVFSVPSQILQAFNLHFQMRLSSRTLSYCSRKAQCPAGCMCRVPPCSSSCL